MMTAHKHTMTAPCPSLNLEALQTWLEDMAAEGYLLKERKGMGRYQFYQIEPLKVRYRLTPVSNNLELWNEAPETEHRTIAEAYGWEYVCTVGYFHIYRSYDADAIELHTDSAVTAEALRQLLRKAIWSACSVVLSQAVYVFLVMLFCWPNGMLRGMIGFGLLPYGMWCALAVRTSIRGIHTTVHLLRLRGQVKRGELPIQRKDWRKGAALHRVKVRIAYGLVFCFVLSLGLYRWSSRLVDEDLPEPGTALPFAAVMDMTGESGTRLDVGYQRNWSRSIAPVNYEWVELVDVGDKRVSMELNYHELDSRWLAEVLTREYLSVAERYGTPAELEIPQGFDFSYTYLDHMGSPSAVVRLDRTVVQVTFARQDVEGLGLTRWLEDLLSRLR